MLELIRYDAMCRAIAECAAVDEAKEIRDKALALEAYYRQARNKEAERDALNVRLRAERRAGEILKELARATPQTANPTGLPTPQTGERVKTPYAEALEKNAISTQSASRFQRLADIPQPEFEAALADPETKPSTRGMIDRVDIINDPQPQFSREALHLWGKLMEFERDGWLADDWRPDFVTMTEPMRQDVGRLLKPVREVLAKIEEAFHEFGA
jgi:hypothetical protein